MDVPAVLSSMCWIFLLTIPLFAAQEFDHETLLDKQNEFYLKWNVLDDYIDICLSAKTTGWLAFGFSPNGGMDQSDVVFAFVDNQTGQANVTDRFITVIQPATVQLQLDKQQDWILLNAERNSTHTTIRVHRKLETCDPMDRPITQDTMRIIFSLGIRQPANYLQPEMHYFRGSRSLNLLDKSLAVRKMGMAINPSTSLDWNVLVDAVTIPEAVTSMYHCAVLIVPSFTKRYHLVKTVPKIDYGNMDLVHHILIYLCDNSIGSSFEPKQFTCMTRNMSDPNLPAEINLMYNCTTMIAGWAMGGSSLVFPDEAGFAVGPELNGRYVYIEMHYNNPGGKKRLDSSGMKLQFTDKLRKYDVGIMQLGSSSFEETMVIPPAATFRHFGICSESCTRDALPADGISVFKGLLHSHLLGRKLRIRHIRNNTELPVLLEDNQYDNYYQEIRGVDPARKIQQGDQLLLECEFSNAAPGSSAVLGGPATFDEMCFGLIYYYPRTDLTQCMSQYAVDTAINALGLQDIAKTLQGYRPQQNNSNTDAAVSNARPLYTSIDRMTEIGRLRPEIRRALGNYAWTPENIQALQNAYDTADGFATCQLSGSTSAIEIFRPLSPLRFISQPRSNGTTCLASSRQGTGVNKVNVNETFPVLKTNPRNTASLLVCNAQVILYTWIMFIVVYLSLSTVHI